MEKIVRNYLEIKSLDELLVEKKPSNNCSLEKVSPNDFQLNKFFYKQIGKNHQWIDRLVWQDKDWIKLVSNENLKTYILKQDEDLVGYFELIFNQNKLEKILVFSKRVPFKKESTQTKAAGLMAFGWFIYDVNYNGLPEVNWV